MEENNQSQPKVDNTQPSNREDSKGNVIFVGNKPLMNYVTGVVMQFNKNNNSEVIIKARGKFIAKAVDIAEVSRRRFLQEQNILANNIQIGTEEYDKEGRKISVSTIDIVLRKE